MCSLPIQVVVLKSLGYIINLQVSPEQALHGVNRACMYSDREVLVGRLQNATVQSVVLLN